MRIIGSLKVLYSRDTHTILHEAYNPCRPKQNLIKAKICFKMYFNIRTVLYKNKLFNIMNIYRVCLNFTIKLQYTFFVSFIGS